MSDKYASFLPVLLSPTERVPSSIAAEPSPPLDIPPSAWDGPGIPELPVLCAGDSLHEFFKESLALARDPARAPDAWLAMLEEHTWSLLNMSRPGGWGVTVRSSDNACFLKFDRAEEASSIFLRCPRRDMEHLDAMLDSFIQKKDSHHSWMISSFSFADWWDAVRLDALAVKLATQSASDSGGAVDWVRAFSEHAARVFSRPNIQESVSGWWPNWTKAPPKSAWDAAGGPLTTSIPKKEGDPPLPTRSQQFSVSSAWIRILNGVDVDRVELLVHALRPVCPEAAAALAAWWVSSRVRESSPSTPERTRSDFQNLIRGTALWLAAGAHPEVTHNVLSWSLEFIRRLPGSAAADFSIPAARSAARVWYPGHPKLWAAAVNNLLAEGASLLARRLDPTARSTGFSDMQDVLGLGPFMAIHESSPWLDILLDMRLQLQERPGVRGAISYDPIWTALSDRRSLDRPESAAGRSTFPDLRPSWEDDRLEDLPAPTASAPRRRI